MLKSEPGVLSPRGTDNYTRDPILLQDKKDLEVGLLTGKTRQRGAALYASPDCLQAIVFAALAGTLRRSSTALDADARDPTLADLENPLETCRNHELTVLDPLTVDAYGALRDHP